MPKNPLHFRKNPKKNPRIEGILQFEATKTLIVTPEERYFLIPRHLPHYLVSGDTIIAEIVLSKTTSRLAEVVFVTLKKRSESVLLGYFQKQKIIPLAGSTTFFQIECFGASKKKNSDIKNLKNGDMVRYIMR